MRFRILDSSGDFVFGTGRQAYAQRQDAVGLAIKTRLQMVLNDCFFSPSGWIDWLGLLGTNNPKALDFAIQSIIYNTPGVNNITSASANFDPRDRTLICNYTVSTVYGASVSGSVEMNTTPGLSINKFVGDLVFDGIITSIDVNVSKGVGDARKALWILYDVDNGYVPVVGATTPLSATLVRVTIDPAPSAGKFRLVGIA